MGEQGTGVQRARRAVGLALAILVCGLAAAAEARAVVTFSDSQARDRFESYVSLIRENPDRFAPEIVTVEQLERSEVEYVVTLGGEFAWDVEGTLTTDGERILINIADGRRHAGELMSTNSRIAHELEHARQFDDGEIAFERDASTGRWSTHLASYDIGDEVKAWLAQLRASVDSDLVRRREGSLFLEPTVLGVFARAETDAERAKVLASRGYGWVSRAMGANVTFGRDKGYTARQLVRPDGARRFFGRVQRVF
jgi:hypothetical protein